MALATRSKTQLYLLLDNITSLGLKIGLPVLVLATAYIAYAVFGGSLKEMMHMKPDQRLYMVNGISTAVLALKWSGIVVVISLLIRYFYVEILGQVLAVLGGIVFFLGPLVCGDVAARTGLVGNYLFNTAAKQYLFLGTVCLIPGLFLVIRNAVWRIIENVSAKIDSMKCWGDEETRKQQNQKRSIYGHCWDMAYCRDFVKKMCPAFKRKKSCWKIKQGCYCDEKTVLQAMLTNGRTDIQAKGILHSLGLDQMAEKRMTSKAKRARCKRCAIFLEHQRQKYRLATPLVFPTIGLLLLYFYNSLYAVIYALVIRTDKFMSILTYKPNGHVTSFANDAHTLTIMGIIWLAVFVLSYSLRTIEYLILDLQV